MGSIIRGLEFNIMRRFPSQFATVAQQVEQFTRNEQVASSNLASSSIQKRLARKEHKNRRVFPSIFLCSKGRSLFFGGDKPRQSEQ